jgi:hypothetical protein
MRNVAGDAVSRHTSPWVKSRKADAARDRGKTLTWIEPDFTEKANGGGFTQAWKRGQQFKTPT